jgi:hypothetical protein
MKLPGGFPLPERNEVLDFAVILLLETEQGMETIRVYDAAHGSNEHRYTRSGGKEPGEIFHSGTLGEGMRAAISEVEQRIPRDDRRMEEAMTADSKRSPAAKVMDEAIDLAIEGRSPYPERAAFVDADAASAGHDIERAADEGLSVVLVSADGSTRVLKSELQTH